MSRKYSEYLSVDSDFIPVFSEHSDRKFPGKWKSFYPHDSFKSILSQLIDTLEKGSTSKDLPMWIYGAYGSGKTFASFVIKHILEDDLSEIEAFCRANDLLPLYSRIEGIRKKGKILVVHRSSSAGIVGNNRLMNSIVESIRSSLRTNGYSNMGGQSQYDIILDTLKDPSASFNFANAFAKYKRKFDGYAEPSSVVRDLEELGPESTADLLETIVEVAELENYFWSTDSADVIAWIRDVTQKNDICAMVFIWDEFTEYFRINQNNITGLQEIAHAAPEINFYFFLITHSGKQIISDQNARKVIEARFKIKPIDMAEATGFKLMGQAIAKDPDLFSEWVGIRDDLWGRVELNIKKSVVQHGRDIIENELIDLLPIHPYAAFLLNVIASEISSNQRTMFQFLSGDLDSGENERRNLRWFIENHTYDVGGWPYLTADNIWDYFFTEDNPDLNDVFRTAIAQYENFAPVFEENDDKLRVLKVALLLSSLQSKAGASRVHGQSILLRATLGNIATAFFGTPIQKDIPRIMAEFVAKSMFSSVMVGDDTLYIPPIGNIDQERFDKIFEEIRHVVSFERILSDSTSEIAEHMLPDGFLQYRYKTFLISTNPNAVKNAIEQAKMLGTNSSPLFYLYSLNEAEHSKSADVVKKLLEDVGRNAVIVDFSSTPFSDDSYKRYLHSKTEERYYGKESTQTQIAKQNAASIIKEWKNKLTVTTVDIYPEADGQVTKAQGGGNIRKKLREFNNLWFGCGLEEISVNDKLFSPSGYSDKVAQMAMGHITVPPNFSYLQHISGRLSQDNIWSNPDYMSALPNHPLSRMKRSITDVIEQAFSSNNSMVSIVDIWNALKKPEFGLMSCSGSVFLMGFLLKEYANGRFYKFDGANTGQEPLNPVDLSNLVFFAVQESPKARNQFILKQKPEHMEFCALSGNVFKIAKDKQNSIQDIAKNIGVFLKDNGYPLWSLKNYFYVDLDEHELRDEMSNAVSLYCELVSPEKLAGRESAKIAEELYALYKRNAGLDAVLTEAVRVENMKTGMAYYIASYCPELISSMKRLGVSEQIMLSSLIKKLSPDSSYLWNVGDTNRQIDNLFDEYALIEAINLILTSKATSIEDAIDGVEKKLNLIRLPYPFVIDECPELSDIFKALFALRNHTYTNITEVIMRLKADAARFSAFCSNQNATFSSVISSHLGQLSSDESAHLFSKSPDKTLYVNADEFLQTMTSVLNDFRKSKKISKLFELWKDNTKTESPAQWSEDHNLSILCLFDGQTDQASRTFDLLNMTRIPQSETEIDKAVEFLQDVVFAVINDPAECERLFINYFCAEYASLFDKADELKAALHQALGDNVYAWHNSRRATEVCVETLVGEKYHAYYKPKVIEKIAGMKADEAQRLLTGLVESEPSVGIRILKMR